MNLTDFLGCLIFMNQSENIATVIMYIGKHIKKEVQTLQKEEEFKKKVSCYFKSL